MSCREGRADPEIRSAKRTTLCKALQSWLELFPYHTDVICVLFVYVKCRHMDLQLYIFCLVEWLFMARQLLCTELTNRAKCFGYLNDMETDSEKYKNKYKHIRASQLCVSSVFNRIQIQIIIHANLQFLGK